MNVGCLVAFVHPLRKVLATVSDENPASLNLKHIAIKVTILTGVSSITTLVNLALFSATNIGHLFAYDWVTNTACLMLMTPYYPDEVWYNKVCPLYHSLTVYSE